MTEQGAFYKVIKCDELVKRSLDVFAYRKFQMSKLNSLPSYLIMGILRDSEIIFCLHKYELLRDCNIGRVKDG